MSEIVEEKAKKKKGGMMKIILIVVGLLALVGGGIGGTLFAVNAGFIGGGGKHSEPEGPRLVPKSEQKRVGEGGEGGEGHATAANKPPIGTGGDKYASNYYAMEKEFTSNLQDSVHFVQVGVAVSTPYDDSVIENIKTNEIAVRSSILMALGDTTEDQVFTSEGKRQLERRVAKAINDTLKEKEGFGGVGNVYFTSFVVQ
ncbi:flagellar basal body-associated FliL family protein [Sphingomonas sp. PvP056]|jgi:flagellar FliL protein|uniref:flagellar basal body-associated FliL family protein n=1 Tax=Sphingomonas sp. PvP056 TaxID=3156392 RepID=UPI00263D6BCA|nr:flagellar basal body-associated FliL family protein [Sphingomonas sp. PsM26]